MPDKFVLVIFALFSGLPTGILARGVFAVMRESFKEYWQNKAFVFLSILSLIVGVLGLALFGVARQSLGLPNAEWFCPPFVITFGLGFFRLGPRVAHWLEL